MAPYPPWSTSMTTTYFGGPPAGPPNPTNQAVVAVEMSPAETVAVPVLP